MVDSMALGRTRTIYLTFFLYGRDSERYALISHIAGSLLEVSPWWPLATMHST